MSSRSFHRPSAAATDVMSMSARSSTVCPQHRLPMARRAEGPAAAFDALRLLRSLDLGRHARSHPRRALREVSRSGRSRGEPDRRDHRQPERQERGKRGTCIDPAGYDAGKKIMGKKRHILVDTQGLLMHAVVHAADIRDRDGGAALMATLFASLIFKLVVRKRVLRALRRQCAGGRRGGGGVQLNGKVPPLNECSP